jgi:flavodoxin I
MKALLVYDSTYGNTEGIARAIAAAIAGEAKAIRVGEAKTEDIDSVDLLIVGSPTQGFQATKPIQVFIASIPASALKGKAVAAFDTRIQAAEVGKALRQFMKIGGYAAPRIARALEKKGGNLAAPPEGFFVVEKEGPLVEGELERAAAWAKGIAANPGS